MKVKVRNLVLGACCLFLRFAQASGQDSSHTLQQVIEVPGKVVSQVGVKAAEIDALLVRQTERYLSRLEKQEQQLKKKLMKRDSLKAIQLFGDVKGRYLQLRASSGKVSKFAQVYSGRLDSLRTGLQFMQTSKVPDLAINNSLQKSLSHLDGLQDRFNQTGRIRKYLSQREGQLKEQLSRLGMVKDLKKFRKQVYYYQAQLKEYKELFNNSDKLEERMMGLLRQAPQFQGFFNRHSQLASLFSLPGSTAAGDVNGGSAAATMQGLQTAASINQVLQERFGNNKGMVKQALQQQGAGKNQADLVSMLKGKVKSMSSGSVGNGQGAGDKMPEFRPNGQKTKSFLNRLEIGTNLQSQKARSFFPVTSDLGLLVGYKLNDKSIIGIGGAYKIGWGRDISHIRITHQGLGMRTFVDYRVKGSFWLSGGGEMNYRSQFKDFDVFDDYSAWQKSALLGLSKKYQVSKKVKGNMQLMYDFLWREQVPRGQAILFRVGYNLR